jgi:hypothetical protein
MELVAIIPNHLDDVYLKETFHEGLHSKLKMVILGMPQTTIIEVVNSAKIVEELMPSKKYTPARSKKY